MGSRAGRRANPTSSLDHGRALEFFEFPRETGFRGHQDRHSGAGDSVQSRSPLSTTLPLEGSLGAKKAPIVTKTVERVDTNFTRMVAKGYCDSKLWRNPLKSSCKQAVHSSQRRDRHTSDNRPFFLEPVHINTNVQDGASREDSQTIATPKLGRHSGCTRRVPVCVDRSRVQEVLLLLPERGNVHVQEDAIWSNDSSLDILKTNENHQEISEKKGGEHKLVHRRLHSLGKVSRVSCKTPEMDQRSSGLARPQNQPKEVIINPEAAAAIPRSRTRPSEPDSSSAPKEGGEAFKSVQGFKAPTICIKARTRRASRSDNVFSFSSSPRSDVCEPIDYVDEYTHFCNCQMCEGQSKRISAKALEAFLRQEFSRNKGKFQTSHPRLGSYDRCFRLWMVWGGPALLREGFLVGLGSTTLYKCKGDVGDSLLSDVLEKESGWEPCNDSHRFRGDIFLYQENGFSEESINKSTCKGLSISLYKGMYNFRGPSYLWHSQCTCGRRIKTGSTQCCRQHVGPQNFRILFQDVRMYSSRGLLCITGEYTVQEVYFPLSRLRSKLCGNRRTKNGLECLQDNLCLSASTSADQMYKENHRVQGKGYLSSPLCKQLCIEFAEEEGYLGGAFAKRLFPIPGGREESSSSQEILQLVALDFITLQVDFPSNRPFGLEAEDCNPGKHFDFPAQPNLIDERDESLVEGEEAAEVNLNDNSSDSTPKKSENLQGSRRDSPPGPPICHRLPVEELPHRVYKDRTRLIMWFYEMQGCSPGACSIMSHEHSERTRRQYNSSWQQFLKYLECMSIPADAVKEATVVNFLEYRLSVHGVLPVTVRQNFYGLIGPIRAAFNLKVSAKDPCSLIRIFLCGALRYDKGDRKDMFPRWKCLDLVNYLKLPYFEPLEEKPLDIVLAKTVVLLMLQTGRRLADVSAMTKDWDYQMINNISYIKFSFFNNWRGKAERPLDNKWESHPIYISSIKKVDNEDQSVLCPLRAFHCFWNLRSKKTNIAAKFKDHMWLCNPASLSYVVNSLLLNVQKYYYPSIPMHERPKIGTHNLRKFAISYSYLYFKLDKDLLLSRIGSRSFSTLTKYYIRNIKEPSFYLSVPLGTMTCNMLRINGAADPRDGQDCEDDHEDLDLSASEPDTDSETE